MPNALNLKPRTRGPKIGKLKTLTNRWLPISIYEYTALVGQLPCHLALESVAASNNMKLFACAP